MNRIAIIVAIATYIVGIAMCYAGCTGKLERHGETTVKHQYRKQD